jgi:uncharacterized protein with PQ loop repeat
LDNMPCDLIFLFRHPANFGNFTGNFSTSFYKNLNLQFKNSNSKMVSTGARDFLGIFGGVVLSICTIPQLLLMWKRRSSQGVSLLWLSLYLLGLGCTIAYLVIQQAYAAYIPAAFEVLLILAMMISKFILDQQYPDKKTVELDQDQEIVIVK